MKRKGGYLHRHRRGDLFEHGCLHDCIRMYTVAEVHLRTGTAGEYTLVSYVRKMVAS
jgi:hypothetical protein